MNQKTIKKLLRENRSVDAEQMEKARTAIKGVRRIKTRRHIGFELHGHRSRRPLVTADDGTETATMRRR